MSSCLVVFRFFHANKYKSAETTDLDTSGSSSPPPPPLSSVCWMPVSPLAFKGGILHRNPSQLWQIARPIKEKPFGSPQTSRPHVAARPPLYFCFFFSFLASCPPGDLTSAGSGVTAPVVSSAMERGGKHGGCRQTRQLAPALTEHPHPTPSALNNPSRGHRGYTSDIHTYSRGQLSTR